MIAEEEGSLIHDLGRHEGTRKFEAYLHAIELANLRPANFGADRIERIDVSGLDERISEATIRRRAWCIEWAERWRSSPNCSPTQSQKKKPDNVTRYQAFTYLVGTVRFELTTP